MTTTAVRQTRGIPAGGQFAPTFRSEPQISLIDADTAGIAAKAAAEAVSLARRRAFLQDQLNMVTQQQSSLSCAAAAHHILERHPDAEVIVFAVKDGGTVALANVLDGAGRILPAHRTGEWADTVTAELRHETARALTAVDGVEPSGRTLHVRIRTVLAGVSHLVSEEQPRQPRHAAFDRSAA